MEGEASIPIVPIVASQGNGNALNFSDKTSIFLKMNMPMKNPKPALENPAVMDPMLHV